MFAECVQLFIPGLVLGSVWIGLLWETNSDLEGIIPLAIAIFIFYGLAVFLYVGTKTGFIHDEPEYSCPAGKVVFYNYSNVICINGEKAKEIRK